MAWAKYGDATGWLISDVFGLKQARSLEAEKAIEAAITPLPPDDPFWPRWVMYEETQKTRYDSR